MKMKQRIEIEVEIEVPPYAVLSWGCYFKRLENNAVLKVYDDGIVCSSLTSTDDDFKPCTKADFDAAYDRAVANIRKAFLA